MDYPALRGRKLRHEPHKMPKRFGPDAFTFRAWPDVWPICLQLNSLDLQTIVHPKIWAAGVAFCAIASERY
jgi:hypothetical protein